MLNGFTCWTRLTRNQTCVWSVCGHWKCAKCGDLSLRFSLFRRTMQTPFWRRCTFVKRNCLQCQLGRRWQVVHQFFSTLALFQFSFAQRTPSGAKDGKRDDKSEMSLASFLNWILCWKEMNSLSMESIFLADPIQAAAVAQKRKISPRKIHN